MENSVYSVAILLFIILDPFGNIPLFAPILERVSPERRLRILTRELLIALGVLTALLFAGPSLLQAMRISTDSLSVAGGIILFLIAVKMVFGGAGNMFGDLPDGEPLIVPLAIPYVAGPSAAATVLILAGQTPERRPEWLVALLLAWALNSLVLIGAAKLVRFLGRNVLDALERLMGLVLTAVAVEMFLAGLRTYGF